MYTVNGEKHKNHKIERNTLLARKSINYERWNKKNEEVVSQQNRWQITKRIELII